MICLAGSEGFSLGLERAGMETIAFCEREPYCQRVLARHWPDIPIHEDIRELDGKQYRGTVDVVCGGFPCQDISPARGKNRKGLAGDSSSLWFAMRDVISDVRPSYIIVENSTELRNNGMSIVLGELASLGYVGFWHCISASYVGAGKESRMTAWQTQCVVRRS